MEAEFVLIHKMRNGDEGAMEFFVRKYYPAIQSYCRTHTYTDADAEDLAQLTFERFFQSFASYRYFGKTANYLYVIARNLCRDNCKKKHDIPVVKLPETGENTIARREKQIDIEDAINKLPEEMREVIILYYFQELKLKEIAEIIGISLSLVKYRMKKAKELLRIYLGEEK